MKSQEPRIAAKTEMAVKADSQTQTRRRIVRNSAWNLLGWGGLLGLSFISSPIMISQLGADRYGIMALLSSVIMPLGLLDFGVGEATVKYMAESFGRNDDRAAERYLRSTLLFNVAVGVGGAIVIVAIAPLLVTKVFNIPSAYQTMSQYCLYLIGVSWCLKQVQRTFVGAVTAKQDYLAVSSGTFLTQFATTVTGLLYLLQGGGLLGMIAIQSAVLGLATLAWLLKVHNLMPMFRLYPEFHLSSLRQTFGFGMWQMLNNLGSILTHQTQRWMLGAWMPVATVGYYSVASQPPSVIYSAAYKVGQVLFPAISEMQGQQKEQYAACMMLEINWAVSSAAIAGLATIGVFAPDILRLWVGGAVAEQAATAMRILATGLAASCLFAIPSFYLLGTGRARWMAIQSGFQGGTTLCVAVLAVPRWGVAGAAASVTVGCLIGDGVLLIEMWRRLFRPWISGSSYAASLWGPLLVGLLIEVLLIWWRDATVWSPGWVALGVTSAVCCAVTLLAILAVSYLLPGGRERIRELGRTVGLAVAKLRSRTARDDASLGTG